MIKEMYQEYEHKMKKTVEVVILSLIHISEPTRH